MPETETKRKHKRPWPMPKATCCLICDQCGNTITEVDLCVESIATVLFKARKEHAKSYHFWSEREA